MSFNCPTHNILGSSVDGTRCLLCDKATREQERGPEESKQIEAALAELDRLRKIKP